jgi:hypothetical protein
VEHQIGSSGYLSSFEVERMREQERPQEGPRP